MTLPLYIFDLDGTIALIDHRRPILDNKDDPHRWQKFYAACLDDEPNKPVIACLQNLAKSADVWVWSGRSDEVIGQTINWLAAHTGVGIYVANAMLRMRPANDYTPDEVLKARWLDELPEYDRARLTAVFDDRDKVVAMWRSRGIACFQVAPGGF